VRIGLEIVPAVHVTLTFMISQTFALIYRRGSQREYMLYCSYLRHLAKDTFSF